MESTAPPNPVLPYTQFRARPPKRFNLRMIVFIAVIAVIPVAIVTAYVNYVHHDGIEQTGDLYKVDLKSLGFFPFDEVNGKLTDVPHKWRNLDGKHVELEGFMFSVQSASNKLGDFQFVYNIQKCCFGGPPKVQERVFAQVPHGRVTWYDDFCKLTGTLHVHVKKDESGAIVSLYTIDVDKLEPEK